MTNLWLLIPSPVRRALAWIGGALTVAFAFYQAGRNSANKDRDQENLQSAIEAHEVRNEVDNRVAADRDPKRELHKHWSE